MPNYVTSRCRVVGPSAEVERFKAACVAVAPDGHSDAGGLMLDFNRIIPMHDSVRATYDETGGAEMAVAMLLAAGGDAPPFSKMGLHDFEIEFVRREAGLAYDASIRDVARAFLEKKPDLAAMAKNRLRCLLETGFTYWYPWCNSTWGTKWGAFRFEELDEEQPYSFRFETAWSFPTPVFDKLATDFPTLSFHCLTFDEGSNFAGEGWFNPPAGEQPFTIGEATDALYECVYGHPRPIDEDEIEDSTS